MKIKNILFAVLIFSMAYVNAFAQIERVIVETYYISDSNDATDTIGGVLEAGSKTFRVYIDLAAGYRIQKIYGDANHLLKISSSEVFFNNISEGQSFGKDFTKSRLGENTVALDTWLTLGQVTKASSKVVGVPKVYDDDGSFIGGINNDGGSAGVVSGLLTNSDPLAGIPLTTSDGNDTMTIVSGSWFDYGILSVNSDDSTIFGSLVPDSVFECNNCGLQYAGIKGVNPDSNFVLLAQLTTKGDISFELNVEIIDSLGTVIKYVANDNVLLPDEVLSRYLKYPFEPICGCPDADYLEYLADRDCDNLDSCLNLVVFGCMDTMACNFDPSANSNIQSLCCYPGKCSDRDLSFVCPDLILERNNIFEIYPNPGHDVINIALAGTSDMINYILYNPVGQKIEERVLNNPSSVFQIDISGLPNGLFFMLINNGSESKSQIIIKE